VLGIGSEISPDSSDQARSITADLAWRIGASRKNGKWFSSFLDGFHFNPASLRCRSGPNRAYRYLSSSYVELTAEGLQAEQKRYANYVAGFDGVAAAHPTSSHFVNSNAAPYDLTNLDRWYERTGEERLGAFTIYRVKLRR
jgi:hypothetical protein